MKQMKKIFQALLGSTVLVITALIVMGRFAWRTIRNWWKRRARWFRRIIATIVIFIPVVFVAFVAYALYEDAHGRDYWDRSVSEDVTLHSFSDNKWRVYNKRTEAYTTEKINWLSDVTRNDSLAVYALPLRRGYINVNTGRIVIDAEDNDYQKAWVFSEGLAAVMKDGKIGFINANNEIVIPFQFDNSDKCRMYDFGYVFHNGFCAMSDEKGKFGLIDRKGNWVLKARYDEIWAPHDSGYRIILNDSMYGILDSTCNVVYSTEYDYIDLLSDGFVLSKSGRKWQVDFEGNVVRPFMFDATFYLNYPSGYDENGDIQYVFADYAKYEVMNRYGIMNRITGKPITLALYSDINMLSKDLFEVQDSESYDWYLVDINGNVILGE